MDRAAYLRRLMSGHAQPVRSPHPLQRPAVYCPGLESRPFHDPARFEWPSRLEAAYPSVLREFREARDTGGFRQYREPEPVRGERVLHDRGDWNVFYFWFEGRRFTENCARCPVTARLLEDVPRGCGLACFSLLAPGTHIQPHCAPFNITLRCHFGLAGLEGARIRVGEETLGWEAGRCLILDDTFEHEVWVEGSEERAILMFDFYHHDLSDAEVSALRETWRSPPAQRVLEPWYEVVGAPPE